MQEDTAVKQPFQIKRIGNIVRLNRFYLLASFIIVAGFVWIGVMTWAHWKNVDVMIKIILHLAGHGSGYDWPVYRKS
jgi:hypothetical protein